MSPESLNQHNQRNNSNNNSFRSNQTQINYNNGNNSNRLSGSLTPATTAQMLHRHRSSVYIAPNDVNSIETHSTPTIPAPPSTPERTPQQPNPGMRSKIIGEAALSQIPQAKPKLATPAAAGTDIIGSVLGDFGIWQLRSVLILFLCKLPASWFMACIIYTAPEIKPSVQYRCDASQLSANQSISENQCYVVDWSANVAANGSTAGETILSQEPCTDFVYDDYFYSFIMQYNLVCMREIFVAWTQYWHLFGVLVGGVIGTKAMLKLSPRTVYIIGAVLQIILGVITGYSGALTMHCIFRCLAAIGCALMFTSAQAIFGDITGGRYRTGVIILYDTFWSLGVILLPGISSFFQNWSELYLGITFPTVILLFLLQWTPESPRWLLKNGKEHDVYRVERMLRKAVDINERTFLIPDDFRQQLEKLRESLRTQKPPATWLQLWRGPRAKYYMLAAHIALACYIVNYMGMLLNLRSFGRNYRVPNTIAMGVAEIIGCFIGLHFAMKHGPKKFMYAGCFNIVAGLVGCLGWTFTGANLNPDLKVALWMIIAVVPKASVSCAQSMMQACMAEVMPPNKKQPFAFSVVTWARIWLLTAPFINLLKKTDVALSLTFFAVLTVIGGICTCMLQPPKQKKSANLVMARAGDNQEAHKKERSPLAATVWTVESDVNNTRL
ncbi:solute carrier family 22 member 13 [Anastrepha obliqua]|uniref:solute carrier family 22 member 13 n=1 Tax=Anastrepha obliqua TaxID=95512 RepID=UPI00240A07FA|nr:solute carrier family 22 member 13 [Anastrepha obliqua]XP_054725150.1 solute carrier family 22 member 13 [Anastrepha obliqua]